MDSSAYEYVVICVRNDLSKKDVYYLVNKAAALSKDCGMLLSVYFNTVEYIYISCVNDREDATNSRRYMHEVNI